MENGTSPLYPVFLELRERLCVVVGGGKVAGRKALGLSRSRALVKVVSPEIDPALESLAAENVESVGIERRKYEAGDLAEATLAFAATDRREVNAAVVREANERGIPVNVADRPSDGDFALPSTLRRGGLQVAVSTGGASPTLARQIRQELEPYFGPEWSGVVSELEEARREGRATDEELERTVRRCLSLLSG
ncbi:precorrin-2 dehydrogenase/sirohydrochlorin ferrochelatase family protein [Rubrobacter aplysinae]|uniref:precorrin-2 dehydrogenase/sirohydrochlorin ferrochelatase family protein n=1 Tax=Rubrobacter aplysinae TaxID=909625 RepID=UPI00069CF369|nr:bifunctional precorrin-2 dehydrogenase/sirohydrochlorin ferrochelatase [Rubrobacter aplysinae]